MINKFKKRIHNKFSNIFNFFFFLRYVFLIFLISITIYLTIPKFFNYNEKIDVFQNYLKNYYGLEIKNFTNIEYKIFPRPHLLLENANLKVLKSPINFKIKQFDIVFNINNIYEPERLNLKKLILTNGVADLDVSEIKNFLKYVKNLEKNIKFNALKIQLKQEDDQVVSFNNVKFSNYGYSKFKVTGKIFNENFKLSLINNNKELIFKILNSGVETKFNFKENSTIENLSGNSKINVSNNFFKFDFAQEKDSLKIENAYFKNRYLTFNLESLIQLRPYFKVNSKIIANKFEKNIISKFEFEDIFKYKDLVKKLNSKNEIIYQKKKFNRGIIRNSLVKFDLENGKMFYSKIIDFSGGKSNCLGEFQLTEEYPTLDFNCSVEVDNKKNLFKTLEISDDIKAEEFKMNIIGSFNILNRKINLDKVKIENIYTAQKNDLDYFKKTFEEILFTETFFKIFQLNKIKVFLSEVM